MIRSVLFFATLLSLAFPQVTRAQYSTRILKYNGKGGVTGVIEGQPSETKRSPLNINLGKQKILHIFTFSVGKLFHPGQVRGWL